MIQSRKFVAAAILVGIALIVAGLLIAPFNASARAAGQIGADVAADRIGGAFAMLSEREPTRRSQPLPRACRRATSASPANCADAVWPNIDASCLSTADGSPAPASPHRSPSATRPASTRPSSSASRPPRSLQR